MKLSGVQIEITSKCNFKCNFCPVSGQGDAFPMPSRKHIDDDKFREIVDAVAGFDLNYVTLNFVGEPMAHPKIFEYLKYVTDRKLPLMLVTNGTLLNFDTFGKLNDTGVKRLKISLQVADKDSFQESRGVKMEYKTYLNKIINVLLAKKKGLINPDIYIDLAFNNTHTPIRKLLGLTSGDQHITNDIDHFSQDIKTLLEVFVENNLFSLERLEKFSIKEEIKKFQRTVGPRVEDRIFLQIMPGISLSIKNFWDHFAHENNYPVKKVNCKPDKLVVDIEGNVTACNRDVLQNTVIANIYTDSMREVLKKLECSINKISKGDSDFDYCTYCKGSTTKRGRVIRSLANKFR
jgi:sulfatase maturation enzyme AslB (radical SAM superfamily)